MAEKSAFIAELVRTLTPLGDVRPRSMFGGHGLFLEGTMFALITRTDELYFRTDDGNRPDYEARALKKFGKMPYHMPPVEALADWPSIENWARGAVDASIRAKSAKR
ncbi:MAG: TfoX/Sxy family protein [Proteobacteria bacterium]|nr:TfoX/Sxy family protein [Pseudomonadota bacterium]